MNLIVAVDNHWGIGLQDRLLFSIPEDMRRFRSLTVGKTVVLGSKTLRTFPGGLPLADRTNIVMTRSKNPAVGSATPCTSLRQLRRLLAELPENEVFVIGGASIYHQLLDYCRYAYVTKVDLASEADCFFPDLDQMPGWRLSNVEQQETERAKVPGLVDRVKLSFKFCLYEQDHPQVWPDD